MQQWKWILFRVEVTVTEVCSIEHSVGRGTQELQASVQILPVPLMDGVKWAFPGVNVPCVYLIHISLCHLIYIDGGCKKSVAVYFLQPGSVLPDFIIILLLFYYDDDVV